MLTNAIAQRQAIFAFGDQVILRSGMPGNKFAPPFDPTPMIIVARHGNMITAESRERKVTRMCHFSKDHPLRNHTYL